MRRILPALIVTVLCVGLALAQTTYRSIQLSQDTTGAFAVDSNFGLYVPGHLLAPTSGFGAAGQPLPTVAGTGSTPTLATTSTDTAGTITAGTSTTQINLTFGRAFLSVPNCVVSWQSTSATTSPLTYTLVSTGININQGSTTGNKINYFCTSPS